MAGIGTFALCRTCSRAITRVQFTFGNSWVHVDPTHHHAAWPKSFDHGARRDRAELRRLRTATAAIRQLHEQVCTADEHLCREDAQPWPCATIHALGARR